MAKKKKRGPKPNHLQIDDESWENALKRRFFGKNYCSLISTYSDTRSKDNRGPMIEDTKLREFGGIIWLKNGWMRGRIWNIRRNNPQRRGKYDKKRFILWR